MDKIKSLFTTGEAAGVCNVSQQTIIRCFDSGRLKGFRIPGSKFRRIPRESLISFMRENGIPTGNFEDGKKKVLIVDDDAEILELIADVLVRDGRFEVEAFEVIQDRSDGSCTGSRMHEVPVEIGFQIRIERAVAEHRFDDP